MKRPSEGTAMFGKETKEKLPGAVPAAPIERGGKKSTINTLLGPGAKYTGKLEASGSVQIDGEFEGEIDVKGTLLVGREGIVRAKTGARSVVVHGKLEGELSAGAKVELMGGATFVGNVCTPSFIIQEQARFEGTCRMPKGDGIHGGGPGGK